MLVRKAPENVSQKLIFTAEKIWKKDFSIAYLHEAVNKYKWISGADR